MTFNMSCKRGVNRGETMNHRGIEFTVVPGVWQWQFRVSDTLKTGKTETKIDLLAVRRVQLRIDRELRAIAPKAI